MGVLSIVAKVRGLSSDLNGRAVASASNFLSKAASKFLDPVGVWDAAALVSLTDGTNIPVDMSSGINFTVTLGGNGGQGASGSGWTGVAQADPARP